MKITSAELVKTDYGGPGKSPGPVRFDLEGGLEYWTDPIQKPLFYGYDLVVLSGLLGSGESDQVGPVTVRRGAFSREAGTGDNPGEDLTFPLATKDPVAVAVVKAAMDGKLEPGPVKLEDFR